MKSNYLLLLILLSSFSLFAQKQNNIWYFGDHAGIEFNTGSPVTLTNGVFYGDEGCASVCDKTTGALLFFTKGDSVWNANRILMPNGFAIKGCQSSTQSSIIVPDPGNASRYFLFTTDCTENTFVNGLNYSIVDMTLAGGLGDIVTSSKNTTLLQPASEKLAAVSHCNGTDFWLITQNISTNSFYAFQVTSTGVSTPIISNTGSVNSGAFGQLKISPDGKKLAAVLSSTSNVEVFDFSATTGIISNPIQLTGFFGPYGIEFSPDNSKLYADDITKIYQYDLSSGNAATINASQVVISNPVNTPFSMQLGPDGKIYIAKTAGWFTPNGYVATINNPNVPGTGCSFVENSVFLSGKDSQKGLPNFPVIIGQPVSSFTADKYEGCVPLLINFSNASTNAISYSWDFSEGLTDTSTNPIHIFLVPGTYIVRLVANNLTPCGIKSDTSMINISVSGCATLGNVFTPNGDGINDVFDFPNEGYRTMSYDIYSRWGNKVYEWSGTTGGWNGKNKAGNPVSEGVYYFIMKAEKMNGDIVEEKGFISLLR